MSRTNYDHPLSYRLPPRKQPPPAAAPLPADQEEALMGPLGRASYNEKQGLTAEKWQPPTQGAVVADNLINMAAQMRKDREAQMVGSPAAQGQAPPPAPAPAGAAVPLPKGPLGAAPLPPDQERALLGTPPAHAMPGAISAIKGEDAPPMPTLPLSLSNPPLDTTGPPLPPPPAIPVPTYNDGPRQLDLGRGVRDGNVSYNTSGDYLGTQARDLMLDSRRLSRLGKDGIPDPSGGAAPLNIGDLDSGLNYGQAYGLASDQMQKLLSQARESEKFGLSKAETLGKLGIEQGRLGQEATRLAVEKGLGFGKLDLDRLRAETEKALGYGKLGLDVQRHETEKGLGYGKLGLDTQLGLGKLGLDRGQLEVGQRKQQMEEYKQGYDIESDKSGLKVVQAMLAGAKDPEEARMAFELLRRLFPGASSLPPGFTPGAPFTQGAQGQEPGQAQPRPPMPGDRQPPQGPAVPPLPGVDPLLQSDHVYRSAFGDQVYKELKDIRKGDTMPASEKMLASAKLLARRMGGDKNQAVAQHMLNYMREHYGKEFTDFMNPTSSRRGYRELHNLLYRPSEEEVVSKQYSDLNRKVGGPKPKYEPSLIEKVMMGGLLGQ